MATLFTATNDNFTATYRASLEFYDSEAHYRHTLAKELRAFSEVLESNQPLPESVLGLYDIAIGCTPNQ